MFLGSTKEEAEKSLRKLTEIKKNFNKYVTEEEVQRAKQLEELKNSLPKEETLFEEIQNGLNKRLDSFADLYNLLPFSSADFVMTKGADFAEVMNGVKKELSDMRNHIEEKIKDVGAENIHEPQDKESRVQSISSLKDEVFGKKAFAFDIDDAIKQYEAELGEIWKFTEERQELYKSYFSAKKNLYEGEGDKIVEIQREQNDYQNEVTKYYKERERASVEEKYKEDKVVLKNQLAEGLITREEYAQQGEQLTITYLENEIALRNSYGKDIIELEEQLADIQLTIRERGKRQKLKELQPQHNKKKKPKQKV